MLALPSPSVIGDGGWWQASRSRKANPLSRPATMRWFTRHRHHRTDRQRQRQRITKTSHNKTQTAHPSPALSLSVCLYHHPSSFLYFSLTNPPLFSTSLSRRGEPRWLNHSELKKRESHDARSGRGASRTGKIPWIQQDPVDFECTTAPLRCRHEKRKHQSTDGIGRVVGRVKNGRQSRTREALSGGAED